MNKIAVHRLSDMKEIRNSLIRKGVDFKRQISGSIERIIHENDVYTFLDLKESKGKGFHISKMVRKDIDTWLQSEENKKEIYKWKTPGKEQFYNLEAIESSIGQPSLAIDINDCYWDTLYRLGYIRWETYIAGRRKKEWKTGRNASVGGLIKTETTFTYINGKPHRDKKNVIRTPIEYHHIRNHVITHVYNMFYRLYEEIGDKFYMFLTDCVYTSHDQKKRVDNFFKEAGYKTKSKPIDFIKVDRENRRIWWHDYQYHKEKDAAGKLIITGADTYCFYGQHQLINSKQ